MIVARELIQGDEEVLKTFLTPYQSSSMHMLNNLRTTGLVTPENQQLRTGTLPIYEGRYYGVFEENCLQGAIVHWWNGNLAVQCPSNPARFLPKLLKLWRDVALEVNAKSEQSESEIKLGGIFGPYEAVTVAKEILGLDRPDIPWACDCPDRIMKNLYDKVRFDSIIKENLTMSPPSTMDESLLLDWIVAFEKEAMGIEVPDLPFITQRVQNYRKVSEVPRAWILLDSDKQPVSLVGISCRLDDTIQIGPVWTPPEQRNRGYAKQLLAQVLRLELERGWSFQATLIADDPIAIRCYEAVGFEVIGRFRLSLINGTLPISSLSDPVI